MAYSDHPTTNVGKWSDAKYTSYASYTAANVGATLVDISSNLGISTSVTSTEVHLLDGTVGGAATGPFQISINDGAEIEVKVAQLPLVFNEFEITKVEVSSDTGTDDVKVLAFFR
tara:strand:+ start:3346 stop:3690 length:345 start_codon:yes stop_codon:yes gene_type:complete